jgi:hypothetical protein
MKTSKSNDEISIAASVCSGDPGKTGAPVTYEELKVK